MYTRKSKQTRFLLLGLALILLGGLSSACTKSNDPGDTEKHVLRIGVLYGGSDNEPYFRQQYTDMFEMQNSNIEFEIVGAINYDDQRFNQPTDGETVEQPDPYEEMSKMMNGQNPVDVVVLDYNMLQRMTRDNLLQNLDPLIERDKFDISDYVPTVIDGIKAAGDNNLYALTPTFTSSALYYNRKLFQEAGVEPPTDKMSWTDILNKARQMTKGEGADRIFGFSFNRWMSDGFSDVENYSQTLQLKTIDDEGKKMLVNNDQWADAWDTVAGLYQDKIVPDRDFMNTMNEANASSGKADPFYGDLFIHGNVAMVIGDSGYVSELKKANDNAASVDDFDGIDWDVVTVPTHPSTPDQGGNIYLSQLMGINVKAQNPEDAWKFIEFTNSKEWAKLKSRSNYELVARKEYLKPVGGLDYNMDAFTTLRPILPSSTTDSDIYQKNPNAWQARQIGYELFNSVVDGSKETKDALAEWETRGNAILEGQLENGDGGVGGGPIVRPMF
ncbi:extracellular solute-binding protein [Paenibacillus sp. HB172176]|uniref:ABC transporter substrate-binding protein n=1 Tax=Paenibacillus sp. HB172176 TaxID=2493690 RepID=UPI00143A9059|nr:extracellular solute-binding protein [Paenibacillus sp. HB172176]